MRRGLPARGPVWWDDGAPDYTRFLAWNTPCRAWYEALLHQADGELQARRGPGDQLRTCSACGHCEQANRRSQAEFWCVVCGVQPAG